jgi:hypothetical protein
MGITNAGKALVAGLEIGTGTAFSYLAVGSGATAFAATQTTLITELTTSGMARHVASSISLVTTTVTNDTSQYYYLWTATGAATVAEAGVLNAASAGTMLARQVLASARTLASGDTFALTYKIIHA